AEQAALERGDDVLRYAPGEINASAAHEDEREIARKPPEAGHEDVERFHRYSVAGFESGGGDFHGRGEPRLRAICGRDRPIEVDQPPPAQDLFGGDAALDALYVRKNLEIPRAARADIDMPAFA